MIWGRIFKNDLTRKKTVTAVLFVFVFLSALLAAAGTAMIGELLGSIHRLFSESDVPHMVQMHSGPLDEADIGRWASQNALVERYQIAEMVPVEGGSVYFADSADPEKNSVMDFYFVVQNRQFDFLLNLDNRKIDVAEGEVAVPVYFMRQKRLSVGDRLRLVLPGYSREFTIRDFVRDAQMNPAVVHSKRFVIHPADYARLKESVGVVEYLIEFQLNDLSKIGEFHRSYQSSGLPKTGPSVDLNLFRTLNALTDGVAAVAIVLIGFLLMLIAMLCIRFSLLATLEEDYREIGVLKAIGASRREVRRFYLGKYVVMAAAACAAGYAVSFSASGLLTADLALYLGKADGSGLDVVGDVAPAGAAATVLVMILLFCLLVLRKFDRVSAVEALRSGTVGEGGIGRNGWRLNRSRLLPVPVFLGLNSVFRRGRMFGLLLFVFAASAFIVMVPIHFLNTIRSPDFISYLGIGRSDLRIDLQHSDRMAERYRQLLESIRQDGDVERYAPLVTSRFKIVGDDGTTDDLSVETGDFSVFPLRYVEGGAPRHENEIALSYLSAKERGKRVGDPIRLIVGGNERMLTVSGIYQDVTNGGRTAKAMLPFDPETVLWYVVSLDLKPGVDLRRKIEQYEQAFYPARVTDLQGYLQQTLGGTISQLKNISAVALSVSVFLSMLITALFLNMLTAKDRPQIAIMRGIGFSARQIRTQYVTTALVVLAAGIALGAVFSGTLGQRLVGAVWSFLGASRIDFVVDPVQAYVLCPLILMSAVTAAAWLSTKTARQASIAEMIKE